MSQSDFQFLQNLPANQWVVLAPHRAKRPDQGKQQEARPACPFCPGTEDAEQTLYQIPNKPVILNSPLENEGSSQHDQRSMANDQQEISSVILGNEVTPESDSGRAPLARMTSQYKSNWDVRVLANKYPFAPIHEVIIHSQDHHKNFDELPQESVEKILRCYKDRFNEHREKGMVYIFHNFGEKSGESLSDPHRQLGVIPKNVQPEIPPLSFADEHQETDHFTIFCPQTSQWPDEVWIAPKEQGFFGDINPLQLTNLAFSLKRLIEIFALRHGHEFPFNFYIYPYKNWYIRIIPRMKRLGGFEVGTNIYVNTQDPKETIAFIKEHFVLPNREKILAEHQAMYHRGV